ncbi:MAG: hypothetical protein BM557_08595 [Flavobacterium sp. MedPE-SWcel]|uniref:hypothetical protein n=1 Tax=uncultured Flavobacterium sp. TaxID=165435 RepID=UPI000913A988|nr:hypothetical protein [uncultured Flavobacterium sp.]OIQ17262.1 MAG: hypothetical protein BM557_08595 [Flavobacterium sp. MedPE-SWcel]
MIRVITTLILFVCGTITAQSQYEAGMQKALGLWEKGNSVEAAALFERIGAAEKDNWLPSYYVALVNTVDAFQPKNKEKVPALLAKAQEAQDKAMLISPDNAELLVMQAMIHTAWIVYDPMTNGMKLSGTVNGLYAKALAIAPENPRVVFSKADFEIGGATYFGNDTTPMCQEIERSITLFANFKPETAFHPNWGLDRAKQQVETCNKK